MTFENGALVRDAIHNAVLASAQAQVDWLSIGSDLEIAQVFLGELERDVGQIVHTEGRFYFYADSHWALKDETSMKRRLNRYDGWRYGQKGIVRMNDRKMSSILTSVANERDEPEFFFDPSKGINAKNGFIEFSANGTASLQTHGREHRQRHTLPHSWNAQAADWSSRAPLLMKLLNGSFAGDDDRSEKIDLVGELLGAAALGGVTFLSEPKAFVLHGRSAGNGKSQILDLARGLLPREAVQAISPTDFQDDRKVIHLAGALLNATDELGTASAITSERFKAIVTGDPVTAREVYRPTATIKPRALHVFAANTLPSFRGGFDRGVQRRLVVLPFNRTIPADDRVPHLGDRIVEKEGDALLAFAVAGASRLIRQGRFSELRSSQIALRDWVVGSDPVVAWLDDCVEFVRGETTQVQMAYVNFRFWAQNQGFDQVPAVNTFSQRVYAEDARITKGPRSNVTGRTFSGMHLNKEPPF